MRLPTGKLHLRALAGSKAKIGDAPLWSGTEWKPGAAVSAVLFVSTLAGGPPPDGSVFWYVTDETC